MGDDDCNKVIRMRPRWAVEGVGLMYYGADGDRAAYSLKHLCDMPDDQIESLRAALARTHGGDHG